METQRIRVVCRTARESDTQDMLEVTKTIWDGEDYVPHVWAEWLADPAGRLMVAEYQGKVVGLGKLTRLMDEDWWLEGLRVDPEYQGKGVATQIMDALLEVWEQTGGSSIRLMTSINRLPVHHLCDTRGFRLVGEYSSFGAPTQPGEAELSGRVGGLEAPTLPFRALSAEEVEDGTAFGLANPGGELTGPLMDMGWQWAPVRGEYIRRAVERGEAWWWRGRTGMILVHLDGEEGEAPHPYIELVACPPELITALLVDFRRLMGAMGHPRVDWTMRLHPGLMASAEAAGFERTWEGGVRAYEKIHT